MDVIHLEVEVAKEAFQILRHLLKAMEEALRDLHASGQSLDMAWHGPSSELFLNDLQVTLQQSRRVLSYLDELVQKGEAEIEEWIQVDQAGAQRLSASTGLMRNGSALNSLSENNGNDNASYQHKISDIQDKQDSRKDSGSSKGVSGLDDDGRSKGMDGLDDGGRSDSMGSNDDNGSDKATSGLNDGGRDEGTSGGYDGDRDEGAGGSNDDGRGEGTGNSNDGNRGEGAGGSNDGGSGESAGSGDDGNRGEGANGGNEGGDYGEGESSGNDDVSGEGVNSGRERVAREVASSSGGGGGGGGGGSGAASTIMNPAKEAGITSEPIAETDDGLGLPQEKSPWSHMSSPDAAFPQGATPSISPGATPQMPTDVEDDRPWLWAAGALLAVGGGGLYGLHRFFTEDNTESLQPLDGDTFVVDTADEASSKDDVADLTYNPERQQIGRAWLGLDADEDASDMTTLPASNIIPPGYEDFGDDDDKSSLPTSLPDISLP